MIFGFTPFTFVHVLLSLIGIFSGFNVMFGLLAAIFVVLTVVTVIRFHEQTVRTA